jgi:hypothetical protein
MVNYYISSFDSNEETGQAGFSNPVISGMPVHELTKNYACMVHSISLEE